MGARDICAVVLAQKYNKHPDRRRSVSPWREYYRDIKINREQRRLIAKRAGYKSLSMRFTFRVRGEAGNSLSVRSFRALAREEGVVRDGRRVVSRSLVHEIESARHVSRRLLTVDRKNR